MAESATPTVTVALCTCDGEAWLPVLLGSLERQTLPPTEVVVCDDASTDGTVAVLRDFAARAPWPVRVTVNPVRLGFSPNFEQAARLASGEVVALADQDDVWGTDKLERLAGALGRPDAAGTSWPGLAFSDADLVDEELRPLGRRAWEALGITDRELALIGSGRAFRVLLRRQRAVGGTVPGATMAFAGRFREVVLPFPEGLAVSGKGFAHDSWITLVVAAVAPVVALPERLVAYRRHPGQQIGLADLPATPRARAGLGALRGARPDVPSWAYALFERLQEHQSRFPCPDALELLAAMIAHLQGRGALPDRRRDRIVPVARELATGRYREWSSGPSSALADLAR